MGISTAPTPYPPVDATGSWQRVEPVTPEVLFRYDTLAGRIGRSGILLAGVANVILAAFVEPTAGMRIARSVVALGCFGVFWWIARRLPSLRFRVVVGSLLSAWVIGGIVLKSRTVWPSSFDMIPAISAIFALVVGWQLALGVAIGAAVALSVAYLSGFSPVPPHFPVLAGNWLVTLVVLLYGLYQLLKTLGAGVGDLLTSQRSLEVAQQQATEVTEELTERVSQRLEALATSLPRGVGAATTASAALQDTLRQSRRRVPPEARLSFGKLLHRVTLVRRQLLLVIIRIGAILLPLQALRLWVADRRTTALVLLTEYVLLVGVALVVRRFPSRWRPAAWVMGAIMAAGFASSYSSWAEIAGAPPVPPAVPLYLMATVLLGVVTGDVPLVIAIGGVMGTLALVLTGTDGVASATVCLVYTVAGVMLTSLPGELLAEIQARRVEARAAIRKRRRVIGTLFHDLANPLMVIGSTLEEAREEGLTAVPAEVPPMVTRMRATIDSALGTLQAEEVVTAEGLLEAVVAVFRTRLTAKGIRLVRSGDLATPLRCRRSLLQDTVLANLVSNAIKFSPIGGTITIHISREGPTVAIEVRDQGAGLPSDVREAVEAGRVAPSRTGTTGEIGTGYGLLLARDYVQEMGGTLAFHHPESGGLTARIILPTS